MLSSMLGSAALNLRLSTTELREVCARLTPQGVIPQDRFLVRVSCLQSDYVEYVPAATQLKTVMAEVCDALVGVVCLFLFLFFLYHTRIVWYFHPTAAATLAHGLTT